MTKMAKEIRVEKGRNFNRLLIDGEEFPYFLSEDGVSTQVRRNEPPRVTVTIIAEKLTVEDSLD